MDLLKSVGAAGTSAVITVTGMWVIVTFLNSVSLLLTFKIAQYNHQY